MTKAIKESIWTCNECNFSWFCFSRTKTERTTGENRTTDMKRCCFWNHRNTRHFFFCAQMSVVLTTKVKKTKTLRGRENIEGKTSAPTVTVSRAGAVRVSGCVSSCLLFPDRLSGEHAGPEEVRAAPPSRDNIAFLPECFRTFQLDSTLRLLSGITW